MTIYIDAKCNKDLDSQPIESLAFIVEHGENTECYIDASDIDWRIDDGIFSARFKGAYYIEDMDDCGEELFDAPFDGFNLYGDVDEDFELTDVRIVLRHGDKEVDVRPLNPDQPCNRVF